MSLKIKNLSHLIRIIIHENTVFKIGIMHVLTECKENPDDRRSESAPKAGDAKPYH